MWRILILSALDDATVIRNRTDAAAFITEPSASNLPRKRHQDDMTVSARGSDRTTSDATTSDLGNKVAGRKMQSPRASCKIVSSTPQRCRRIEVKQHQPAIAGHRHAPE